MKEQRKNFSPTFGDESRQAEEARKRKAAKISETKQKKADEARELEAPPFFVPTTHGFMHFPKKGGLYINPSEFDATQELDAETWTGFNLTKEEIKKKNVAFVSYKNEKTGKIQIFPTLSRRENALTVALLAEFIDQSRTYADEVDAINKAKEENERIRKENFKIAKANKAAEGWNRKHPFEDPRPTLPLREEVPVPLVRIGQNAEEFDKDFQDYLFAKFKVNALDTYRETKTGKACKPITEAEIPNFPEEKWTTEDGTGIRAFRNIDGAVLLVYKKEIIRGVETWHCKRGTSDEDMDVLKWKADKFIFLNLSEFWKKYFKSELQSDAYYDVLTAIQNLGRKSVPAFSQNGSLGTSQFFVTHANVLRHGRNYYALLVMTTPDAFDGIETQKEYLKLPENFENTLSQASDVEIRFWLDIVFWNRWNKYEQSFSCQDLFKRYGKQTEIEHGDFTRFWERFLTAAFRLLNEQILSYITINGRKMTKKTKAAKTDKVRFGISKDLLRRRPPKLESGESE